MPASRSDIKLWLNRLYGGPYTHMIVVCDTFDWEDYPVYVSEDEDVHEVAAKYTGEHNAEKIMEVYSRNHTREEQMAAFRAFNYD